MTKKIYSYAEALVLSTEYFNGDELPAKVFLDKYALRNNEGELLECTPDNMHHRLAKEFARIESKKFKQPLSQEEIYNYFQDFKKIIPQGSPMYGIGNNYTYQSLGNCFTLGEHPHDSYSGILYADTMMANLFKRRAGVGVCLDNIRPKGLPTKNAAKTTDGIGVFMERYSNTTREVAQNGRRGALLEGLSVHHPEIETFINIKRDLTKVTGANISVLITNEFMRAVEQDEEYEQRWPVNSDTPEISQMVSAKHIWNQIIDAVTQSAEPGVLYLDRAREYSLAHQYSVKDKRFADIICNPCGELWIGLDSCRLMSINLFTYVLNPFTTNATFDFQTFNHDTQIAQRLMDDMVDLEIEKIDNIIAKVKKDKEPHYVKQIEIDMWENYKETAILGRRTGLGITGLGDAIAALNIKYGSEKSINITEEIYRALAINSMISSCNMAKELGAFPLYDAELEINNKFLNRLLDASAELKSLHDKYGRRNISLTTTAPTGSVSILCRTTSGIEPVFLLEYIRRRKLGNTENQKPDYIDDLGDKWEHNTVKHYGLQLWSEITGKTNIEESPYYQATSADVDWKASVRLQAVAQKWISHSISKTCNVPKETTKETIAEIYMESYKQGCKGFTVYRDGSRSGVLIKKPSSNSVKKRPVELPCDVHHISVMKQPYFVLVGLLNEQPYEVFAGENGVISPKVKKGTIIKSKRNQYKVILEDEMELSPIIAFTKPTEDVLTRFISLNLRHGVPIAYVVEQLEKCRENDMTSFSKSISRALKKYIADGTPVHGMECPDCKGKLIRSEGCITCLACGFSKCA